MAAMSAIGNVLVTRGWESICTLPWRHAGYVVKVDLKTGSIVANYQICRGP